MISLRNEIYGTQLDWFKNHVLRQTDNLLYFSLYGIEGSLENVVSKACLKAFKTHAQ